MVLRRRGRRVASAGTAVSGATSELASSALVTGCCACRAWSVACGCAWSASGSPRMREHRRSAARSGSAAIVWGLSARRPRPRVARVAASRAGPESAPWNLRAWLFGFWPHFVLIDFFLLVLLPIGMHRSYSWCRP